MFENNKHQQILAIKLKSILRAKLCERPTPTKYQEK